MSDTTIDQNSDQKPEEEIVQPIRSFTREPGQILVDRRASKETVRLDAGARSRQEFPGVLADLLDALDLPFVRGGEERHMTPSGMDLEDAYNYQVVQRTRR